MSKKLTIRVLLLLLVSLGVFIACSVISVFIPRHGTAAHVSDLKAVYAKAGSPIADSFTNSLIQKFPFAGSIGWKLIFFKDTALFLSGKIDTNGLPQFISSHPDTKFLWSGAGSEIEEGWPSATDYPTTTWTNVWFETEWKFQGYPMSIQGQLDLRSNLVTIRIW